MNLHPMNAMGFAPRSMACAVRAALLGMGLVMALPAAHADEDDVPLYLQISQYLEHDNNFFKNNREKASDVISTTQARVGIDKQYGRQAYNLDATIGKNKYKNHPLQNNDSYTASGAFMSDILADFRLTARGQSSRQLQSFAANNTDQSGRDRRNLVRNSSASVDLRYGLHGRFSVNGGLSSAKLRYDSIDYSYSNRDTQSKTVGLRYSPSEPLNFGISYTKSDIDLPKLDVYIGTLFPVRGEKIDRDSIQFTSSWTVTGYSVFNGSIGATRERYSKDERRNFNGVTGGASWRFTPSDKTSYVFSWSRDTNNEGGRQGAQFVEDSDEGRKIYTVYDGYSVKNRTVDQFSVQTNWQASAKIALNGNYSYSRYAEEQLQTAPGYIPTTNEGTGVYQAIAVGLDYTPVRYLQTGCSLSFYDRTESALTDAYDGRTVKCYAGFVFQ